MLALEIRRLSERDITGGFSAGSSPDDDVLNKFFRCYAKQSQRKSANTTYVAWKDEEIVGFVTIVGSSINPADISEQAKGLGKQPQPVLLLARMATDFRFQKQGVGTALMREIVFARALKKAEEEGCLGICVDPKPRSVTFYERWGFAKLPPREGAEKPRMFLPLDTVRKAMKEPAPLVAQGTETIAVSVGQAPSEAP